MLQLHPTDFDLQPSLAAVRMFGPARCSSLPFES